MRPAAILETALYCPDLEAAAAFYEDVMGLEPYGRQPGRHVFFRCGAGMLLLFDPDHTEAVVTEIGGRAVPLHGARGPGHVAFAATAAELDAWETHLAERGVAIEARIDWPAGGRSLYLRDPAGNSVELAMPEIWSDH